jgi:distribution and morphology protein 31
MFYDLMSAESITGQMDNCLFSLHMPQKLGKIIGDEGGLVKRMARFRIDGLPIEHAQYATGHTGPMSWITSGRLDAVLDIKFPYHPDEQLDLRTIFDQIGRNVATITNSGVLDSEDIYAPTNNNQGQGPKGVIPGNSRLARPPLRAPQAPPRYVPEEEQEIKREVTVDIDLRFRDLKAAVPMFTTDLSVTNNAFIRPVVAFIK